MRGEWLTSVAEVVHAMALSIRVLVNYHCRSRAISMREQCAASSFSGSPFCAAP